MTGTGIGILAGGEGRRIGQDKAVLKLGKETLLEMALNKARPLGLPVRVLSGKRLIEGVNCIQDSYGKGPMAGLYAALGFFEKVLMFPVDMPFLTTEFLRFLLVKGKKHDVLICRVDGHIQPQIGVYSHRCLPLIEARLERGDWMLKALIEEPLNVGVVEEEEIALWGDPKVLFLNINTHADLHRAQQLIGGEK